MLRLFVNLNSFIKYLELSKKFIFIFLFRHLVYFAWAFLKWLNNLDFFYFFLDLVLNFFPKGREAYFLLIKLAKHTYICDINCWRMLNSGDMIFRHVKALLIIKSLELNQ